MKPQSFKKNDPRINRKGAPKREWTWSGLLADAVEEEEDGEPIKKIIARSLLREAKRGNILAQKELMNRMDGMPKQAIEHEGELDINSVLHVYKPEKRKD